MSFDGLSGTDFWAARDVAATERIIETGLDPFWSGIVVATLGLLLVFAFAFAAFLIASTVAAGFTSDDDGGTAGGLAETFAHSLVPIAASASASTTSRRATGASSSAPRRSLRRPNERVPCRRP